MGSGKVDMDQSDATRMRGLLVEAVTTLCRNGMRYDEEIKVEGLLAITRDQKDILIVNFNKTFTNSSKSLGSKAINDSISCLDHADSEHSDSGNHAQGRLIKKGKRKRRKKISVGTVSPEKRTKPCRPSEDMDESDASVGTGSDNCSPGSYEITDQKNGNMPDDPTLTEAKRICKVEVHSESEEVIPDGKEQLRSQLAGDLTLDNAEPVGLYAAGVSIPCGDGSQQSSVPVAASSHSQSSYKVPTHIFHSDGSYQVVSTSTGWGHDYSANSENQAVTKSMRDNSLLRLQGEHWIEKIPPTEKRHHVQRGCKVCNAGERRLREKAGLPKQRRPGKESCFQCAQCLVTLCKQPCFRIYHTAEDYLSAYVTFREEEQSRTVQLTF